MSDDAQFRRILAREATLSNARMYSSEFHQPRPFEPGVSWVPVAGRVWDEEEVAAAVSASLDFWLTAGPEADRFEKAFAARVGTRFASFCNSGSSANLLAVSALTSPSLGDRRLHPGDEVITVAACFPTTVAPIVQVGAVPVFVDLEPVDDGTYNADIRQIEKALNPKTKAVVLAHTLGNPFYVEGIRRFCDANNLWLVEDCCDALGSTYAGKNVGTIGDLSTFSFYPAHHITTGEGGMVCTDDQRLRRLVESFRDWGRDCNCRCGQDNKCGKRHSGQHGTLPEGYDHKYVAAHLGYNLKATDIQAAIGLVQLQKLDKFIEVRKRNWQRLRDGLDDLADVFILPHPTEFADPSWFGFALTCQEGVDRRKVVEYLEAARIQTRLLFAGNITKHPCMDGKTWREIWRMDREFSVLRNTDRVMRDTFWLGVYPGLADEMIDYVIEKVHEAVKP